MLAYCLVHVLMMGCRHAMLAESPLALLAALQHSLQTLAPWLLLSQRDPWHLTQAPLPSRPAAASPGQPAGATHMSTTSPDRLLAV